MHTPRLVVHERLHNLWVGRYVGNYHGVNTRALRILHVLVGGRLAHVDRNHPVRDVFLDHIAQALDGQIRKTHGQATFGEVVVTDAPLVDQWCEYVVHIACGLADLIEAQHYRPRVGYAMAIELTDTKPLVG